MSNENAVILMGVDSNGNPVPIQVDINGVTQVG